MNAAASSSIRPAASRRWPRFPSIVAGLGTAAIIFFEMRPEMERNFKVWICIAILFLVLLLNFLWFVFSSRFSGKTRLIGLAGVVLIVLAVRLTARVDGTLSGIGLPRLAWKWSRPALPRLESKAAVAAKGGEPVVDEARLASVADVPQFFGPHRDGTVTGAKLARDWKSSPPKELWRQPIGTGWCAFAVVKGRAYTQEQRGDDEMVSCYDLFTGKLLWEHADKTCFTQWQSGTGPHATPTVDTGRADALVYTYGGSGLLTCLDANTGQLVWQRSVLVENHLANLQWGISASPLLVDDMIVVTGGNPQDANANGPTLFAYQRDTGKPLWQSGSDRAGYASPLLATLAGKRVILSNNARGLSASEPESGRLLLDCTWGGDKVPKASQPVVIAPDRVFVSAGYGLGCHLFQIKAEGDSRLTATELWRSLRMKTQFNTPAVRDGCLYGLDDGRLACVDLVTGERLWKDGSFGSGQSLLVDDLLLVQSEAGPVYLAAAKPEGYEELGRIEALTSKTWNHPTLAGCYLLVRNDREAVCYELPVVK